MTERPPTPVEGNLNIPTDQKPFLPPTPKIDAGVSKSFEDQFKRRLDEMARKATNAPAASPGLVVDQIGKSTAFISVDPSATAQEHDSGLDEVRRLIGEDKHREALALIEEVLRKSPTHDEALYLRALCQFSMGALEPALESLSRIGRGGREGSMDSRVRLLRTQIRERLTPQVMLETALMGATGMATAAIARLDRLTELDPDGAIFHLLRTHTLLLAGRLADAARAASQAEPHCHGSDREALQDLRHEIGKRELTEKLKPAREAFRNRQYRRARAAMEAHQSQYGKHPFWSTFYTYLEALGGGLLTKGKSPQELAPRGSPAELDQLYFFLVQKELEAAKPLMNAKEYTDAERVLDVAHQFAPRFPWLNFLSALCIHESLSQSFEAKQPPPIAEVVARMKRGRAFAQVAVPDKEISNAQKLFEVLDEGIKTLEGMIAESAQLDVLAERFKALMTELTTGKPKVEKLFAFLAGMQALKTDVDRALARPVSDRARKGLTELKGAIETVVSQLSKAR